MRYTYIFLFQINSVKLYWGVEIANVKNNDADFDTDASANSAENARGGDTGEGPVATEAENRDGEPIETTQWSIRESCAGF